MSVRQFSNQFCSVCGRDTLHYVSKCRECGHVNMTPTEVRQKAKLKSLLRKKDYGLHEGYVFAGSPEEYQKIREATRAGRAKAMTAKADALSRRAALRKPNHGSLFGRRHGR